MHKSLKAKHLFTRMAHCKSFPPQASSFTGLNDGRDSKLQDPLPLRKRLLAGLKDISVLDTCTWSGPLDGDAHLESPLATAGHAGPPPYSLLYSESLKCFSCGDGGVLLHRVPYLSTDNVSNSYQCSSCVLSVYKHLYCVLCFQVMEGSKPSSASTEDYLTCCRCQCLTHLECMLKIWSPSLEGAGLTLCRDCYTRNNGNTSQLKESASKRRQKTGIRRSKQVHVSHCKGKAPTIDKQTLIATKVVAEIAQRMACEAKQRAKGLAKAAVEAAMQAKMALDNAYESGVGEEKQHTSSKSTNAASKDGGGRRGSAGMAKNPKGSKRRALSAIVASEALARNLANESSLCRTKKKRKLSDPGVPFARSPEVTSQVAPQNTLLASPNTPQSTRVGTKRRKTLASLGLQVP